MDEQSLDIIDFLKLVLFLGSITYLTGAVIQGYILRKLKWFLLLFVLLLEKVLSICMSIAIWIHWPFSFDIMVGFVLLPAILPEVIFTFMVWRYSRLKNNK
jgi:hypothetical protein